MTDVTLDLNQTITSAVNARIEAEVAKALAGDEVIGRYVTAALQQNVEVTRGYTTTKTPYLTSVLQKALQDATRKAVERLLQDEIASIEDAVRKALRRDLSRIAETLVGSLAAAAEKPYGVDVQFGLKMPGGS